MIRCLDTYALVELKLGNPKFRYLNKTDFVIPDITLAEFYYVVLRNEGEEKAEYWFEKLKPYSSQVDKYILKEAMKFRSEHKKSRISFFDSVGYIFAVKNKFRFVTGDKEFEKFPRVEFVKK